ncbi:MAG TPA: hypothetical protein GXX17_00690 [Clostridiales bacterium]|nr:hypothetical protein [Clostridiales bacterium]
MLNLKAFLEDKRAILISAISIVIVIAIITSLILFGKDKAHEANAANDSSDTSSLTVSVVVPDIITDSSDTATSTDNVLHLDVGDGKRASSQEDVSEEQTVKPTDISLNKSSVTLLKGESFTIKTTFIPANTSQIHKGLTFKTSNANIATVSKSGTIKANGKGNCVITVSCVDVPSISKQVNVTVYENESSQSSIPQTGNNGSGNTSNSGKYNCGNPLHHCVNEAGHNYLVEIEEEGCPYCGSHSCPSFYTVDKWGYPIIDPTVCPQYDVKKDPTKYCQDCGRPIGSKKGQCLQFLISAYCDICGKWVEGRTCHYHDD